MPEVAPWRALADGVELSLRVTPGARRTAIDGIETRAGQPVLRLRVTAPPDKGRANKAVIALLAKTLRAPKSAIAIAAGHSARDKRVRIAGDPASLTARLTELAG
jgi:uncharacterized protein (TIGR00251 family)